MQNRFYGEFDWEHLPGKRPENDRRTPFQVDRDRVIFSNAFRQLQSKTQVFQSGEYDFYRTRLTHTIEVARIARSIAEHLNQTSDRLREDFYIDCDLVEAVGLAHDLGHPPFGHIGERKLNELMREHGGFEGNAQSLRIISKLIYARPEKLSGMKPTRAFLDGILKYKALYSEYLQQEGPRAFPEHHFLYDEQLAMRNFAFGDLHPPTTGPAEINQVKSIECQIMDWADDTAYSLHDIVDGIKARFITADSLNRWGEAQQDLTSYQLQILDDLIQEIRREGYEPKSSTRIGEFINACHLKPHENFLSGSTNRHRFQLVVTPQIREVCELNKRIAIDLIFKSPPLQQIEFKGGRILDLLFEAFSDHIFRRVSNPLNILPEPVSHWMNHASSDFERYRLLCDYLAALTDGQAIRTYKRLFEPDPTSLTDLY